jgi:hypothetical protein
MWRWSKKVRRRSSTGGGRFVGTALAQRHVRQAQRALGHQRLETTVAHYVLDALQQGRY